MKVASINIIGTGSGAGIGFVLAGNEGAAIGFILGQMVALGFCAREEL